MQAPAAAPLVCHGHSRPINHLEYSNVTEDGVFLISSSKGARHARSRVSRARRALSLARLRLSRAVRACVPPVAEKKTTRHRRSSSRRPSLPDSQTANR